MHPFVFCFLWTNDLIKHNSVLLLYFRILSLLCTWTLFRFLLLFLCAWNCWTNDELLKSRLTSIFGLLSITTILLNKNYSQIFFFLPKSVCIQPWSRLSLRNECKCRVIAATIPGTPATVSRKQMRLHRKINSIHACISCGNAFTVWA